MWTDLSDYGLAISQLDYSTKARGWLYHVALAIHAGLAEYRRQRFLSTYFAGDRSPTRAG